MLNELIKMMKKKEVQNQGKPSQSRQVCELDKFWQLVKGLQNSGKKNLRYVVLCVWQNFNFRAFLDLMTQLV